MYLAAFNVVGGLLGGLLIGAASTALLATTGKITGISGILHSLVTPRSHSAWQSWRTTYALGLFVAGLLLSIPAFDSQLGAFGDASSLTLQPWAAVIAGLAVGFGTRLGGGCTSGHGVCGLPRLSPRSFTAVGECRGCTLACGTAPHRPSP